MKLKNVVRVFFLFLVLVAFLYMFGTQLAFATDDCRQAHQQCGHDEQAGNQNQLDNEQSQGQGQDQSQGQQQGQDQGQQQTASADNLGNSQVVQFSQHRQVPNMYLNQSGNMIDCARIIGFGGANTKGSFMLGIPAGRQRDCDIWAAVNEAQENGHVALSYAFMCEIKNISKVWGKERCNELTAAARNDLNKVLGATDALLMDRMRAEQQHEEEIARLQQRIVAIEEQERLDAAAAKKAARQAQDALRQQKRLEEERKMFAQQALQDLEEYRK